MALDEFCLLGLPFSEAQQVLLQASVPLAGVARSVPPRARHAFPAEAQWRVARVVLGAHGAELLIVPPILLSAEEETRAD